MPMPEELETDIAYFEDDIIIPNEILEIEPPIQVGNYFRIVNNDDVQQR